MKRLIVGDIQGCFEELKELLDRSGISSDDEIISVGDMVDRGPDSPGVIQFFQKQAHARSVMGNHERKHIRSYYGEINPSISQVISRSQIGEANYPAAVAYMETLPIYLDLPELLVVHAFYEPGVPLSEQKEEVLVGIMSGQAYITRQYQENWWELYDGPKPLFVGHHDYSNKGTPLIYKDRVFCIDTGCCYGRTLTGVLLPDFKIISVRARANHWSRVKKKYLDSGKG
ncbi:serine/threonine protein phosphatase [bacterium]|nr:serine/threonine protein phosphatase [bacterium]